VSLPAIVETPTRIAFPGSGRRIDREEGDVLWEAREGRSELEAVKVRIGSFAFAAQYQQAPISREGNRIKVEWLTATYRAGALPPRFDSLAISLDTAYKTGSANDYSALVVIGSNSDARDGYPPGHYVLDAWRGRIEFGELKRKVVEFHNSWNAHVVLIEDTASGQSLIQELQTGTSLPIKKVKVDSDKESRVSAIVPILEARRLILPEIAWWRQDFIAELTSFPNGAHDDWVDAVTQALNHLRGNSGFATWITYMKLERAMDFVREGLAVKEASARVEISETELQNRLADLEREAQEDEDDDDPGARWYASAQRLIEAYHAHSEIQIDPLMYKSYYRMRLLHSSDPDGAKLVLELDERFRNS
jgi:predicted phage terminase large subunit-like protein